MFGRRQRQEEARERAEILRRNVDAAMALRRDIQATEAAADKARKDLERIYRHLSIADKIALRDAILAVERWPAGEKWPGWTFGDFWKDNRPLDHFGLIKRHEQPDEATDETWPKTWELWCTEVTARGRAMWAYIVERDGLNEQSDAATA